MKRFSTEIELGEMESARSFPSVHPAFYCQGDDRGEQVPWEGRKKVEVKKGAQQLAPSQAGYSPAPPSACIGCQSSLLQVLRFPLVT